MSAPLFHTPAAQQILKTVSQHFYKRTIYRNKGDSLIFVCGGADGGFFKTSARQEFIKWANKNLNGCRIIKAESVVHYLLYEKESFINIATLERLVGDLADCVILFPESPGSFAETGLFSAIGSISKKCFIIHCTNHQRKSFLTDGSIATIANKSKHGGPLYTNLKKRPIDFTGVTDKLNVIKRKNRYSISESTFNNMKIQDKFAILHYIFHIFPRLTQKHLLEVLTACYKPYNKDQVTDIIAILQALHYVKLDSADESFYLANLEHKPLIEIEGRSLAEVRLQVTSECQQHMPSLMTTRWQS